jgi:hypothetical protein
VADVAVLRKRIKAAIESGRQGAAARRERATAASRSYEAFLNNVATPAFRQVANVLRSEGLPFDVQTPGQSVHLVSDRGRDDRIELELDTTHDPPLPILIVTRSRGGRLLRTEQPVKANVAVDALTEDDLIERLLAELKPWFE